MLLGGLWHGAAWTFVAWGAYHSVLLIIHRLFLPFFGLMSKPKSKIGKNIWFCVRVVFFFHIVCIGWLLFRAQSMRQAGNMLKGLVLNFNFVRGVGLEEIWGKSILFIMLLFIVQIFQYKKDDLFVVLKWKPTIQIIFYIVVLYSILLGVSGGNEFIYFQF